MTRIARPFFLFLLLLSFVACRVHYVDSEDSSNGVARVWVAIRPTQCSIDGAWREDWVATHAGDAHYPFGRGEIAILQEFCAKQGIVVFDATTRPENGITCSACTCSAHYTMFLLVGEEDVDAIGELGGIPARPN